MKYDKEHVAPIIESLLNGDGRVRAVNKGRISYETFTEWMADKPEFAESVKKAESTGNDKLKDICKRRILEDKSWQSAAWWLERNYPGEYRAVWGEVEIIEDTFLGLKTNRNSSNWFAKVGSENNHVIIAGCQVHYAIRCENKPNNDKTNDYHTDATVGCKEFERPSQIWVAS